MIVGVYPLAGFDKLLHYRVPEAWQATAGLGALVRVPVRSALRLGIVGAIGAPRSFPVEKLKALAQVVHPFPALAPDLLELARWMAVYYAAPMEGIIEAMIPAAVRRGAGLKQERLLSLARQLNPEEMAALTRRARPSEARVYSFLAGQIRPQPKSVVLRRLRAAPEVAAALIRRGLVREESRRIEREAYSDEWSRSELVSTAPPVLNRDQRAAVDAVELGLTEENSAPGCCMESPGRERPRFIFGRWNRFCGPVEA